jgi:pimeloyl-ACP methyl ester carboxylesterase
MLTEPAKRVAARTHVMTGRRPDGALLADPLLEAQLRRTLGTAGAGGADLGECLTAARAVRGSDLDSWYEAWTDVAARVHAVADAEALAGHTESARGAYLRASNYYRTAGVMQFSAGTLDRLKRCDGLQRHLFSAAAALMDPPAQRLRIPFGATTLPGWFFSSAPSDEPRATVILTGGYDGPCEELYLLTGAAAQRRGYNVLAFDGPGQGAALLDHGLTLRPDWETVVAAVIDHAVTLGGVDADRIALVGLSLGAHLAARAASGEPRLAAVIADCGSFDLYEAFLRRLPGPLAGGLRRREPWARATTRALARRLVRRPTAGWALRRGMLVHGASSPLDYLDDLRNFSLAGRAEQITCPTWVCNAENDDIGASAPDLVARLRCPHEFVQFRAADGAGDHCEASARSLYHAASFGWLDELLTPSNPGMRT